MSARSVKRDDAFHLDAEHRDNDQPSAPIGLETFAGGHATAAKCSDHIGGSGMCPFDLGADSAGGPPPGGTLSRREFPARATNGPTRLS